MHTQFFRIFFLIFLLLKFQGVKAQVEEEYEKQNKELVDLSSLKDFREDWIPTLLSSASLPIYNLSQFNGYVFSWLPRGYMANRSNYMDGINWQSKIGDWNAYNTYAGLYRA
ncbi:MAG: hypothetical protein ACR2IM_05495, partial [Sediminibacterium sp.]